MEPQFFTPVFWSALAAQLRYCGNTVGGWDDVVIQGDLDQNKWVAYYTRGNTAIAMASMGSKLLLFRLLWVARQESRVLRT